MHYAAQFARSARKPLCTCFAVLVFIASIYAAEYRGQVVFKDIGVPGAAVTASLGEQKFTAITDAQGEFAFAELVSGTWIIQVDMQAFSQLRKEVNIEPGIELGTWDLQLLPIDQIQGIQKSALSTPPAAPESAKMAAATKKADSAKKAKKGAAVAPTNTQTPFQRIDVNAANPATPPAGLQSGSAGGFGGQDQEYLKERAADGFLINGTANNSASSSLATSQAFGNFRGIRPLYSGNAGLTIGNSGLDARAYSLTGMKSDKPSYNHIQGNFSFGGPVRIPHLIRNGGTFFVGYQFTRSRTAQTESALVPTEAERAGDLSQSPGQIFDPTTNLPFDNNQIPSDRISPQAQYLLKLYPLPNFAGSNQYNYQLPVTGVTHQDSVQSYLNRTIGRKNQVSGTFGLQNSRSENVGLFGFRDTSRSLSLTLSTNWRRTFTPRFFANVVFQFSRQSNSAVPFFQNRENISDLAGIKGNNQDPVNWGPPNLTFSSGLASLSDTLAASTHTQSSAVSYAGVWNGSQHSISFGAGLARLQLNNISQQDPRGSFTFTGTSTTGQAAGTLLPGTRKDFAGFLLGIPDAVSIAFGNADKYFRSSSYNAYLVDDWRVNPNLTLNIGLRWEYWSPVTELYGRLVNLDVSPGFAAVAPVIATDPVGQLTGKRYPSSLLHPDKRAFEPRIGFSWRPIAGTSTIVRGGYGVYYNTSPYQSIVSQMAQQSPLSKSLKTMNSPQNPLTLENAFHSEPNTTANTFAVDPELRIGYLHIWQLSIQQDLPAALQLTVAYQGTRGRNALQRFLPNTYPIGAVNPCPSCPSGFVYMTSNGTSTREAGSLQLRRRLHAGLAATMEYTFSKSIDNASPGGSAFIAQNWLNMDAERALSSFDRRHVLRINLQYTTGMGIAGGTLLKGWRGSMFKEWTISSEINATSGLPLTPVYPAAVAGTGFTGPVRPDYTGTDVKAAPRGLHLNPAAYGAPEPGHWGNAGRNSITGPSQFSLNASLGRIFRVGDRNSLDLRIDANNPLNHVTFPSWNTMVGSSQFGLPATANSMRSIRTTLRWRF